MSNVILFTNNGAATLAGPISNSATSANLAAGTGSIFSNPAPASGQYYVATLISAANELVNEIVHITAVSGDTVTLLRAQEGTTALAWVAGDLLQNLITAGQMNEFLTIEQADETFATIQQVEGFVAITVTTPSTVNLDPATQAPYSFIYLQGSPGGTVTINFPSGAQYKCIVQNSFADNSGLVVEQGTGGSTVSIVASLSELIYCNFGAVTKQKTQYDGISITGASTAITQATGENTTRIATDAFVNASIFAFKGAANTWTGAQTFTGGSLVPNRTAGDATTNSANTAFVQNALGALFSTLTDQTANRVIGTSYTNTTGRPMSVSVVGRSNGALGNFNLLVNGLGVFQFGQPNTGALASVTAIVPAGSSYQVTANTATFNLVLWAEAV